MEALCEIIAEISRLRCTIDRMLLRAYQRGGELSSPLRAERRHYADTNAENENS